MHHKLRLGFGAGLAATAVLAMAGCSGHGGNTTNNGTGTTTTTTTTNGSAISLVADAMNKANSAGTVKVTGSISVAGTDMTLSADEQYSPSLEMSMTMQGAGQNITEVFVGNRIYMQDPALSAELGGKQWAEIDLGESKSGSLGSLASLINSERNANPTTQLSAMIASKQVTEVGTETVQGQQTTHYSGTLNVSQFLQDGVNTANLSSSEVATLKSTLQAGGVSSEKVDVWVASDGLPVQEKVAVDSSAGEMDMTMDMSDWGAPVSVSAPPAGQVADITAEINAAMASASAN